MRNMLLKNWNWMRIFRLALGVGIIFQGVDTKELSYVILGGAFSLMAITNSGCCSNGNCSISTMQANTKNPNFG